MTIPDGIVVIHFKSNDPDATVQHIPFPIDLEYGSVGFRNFNDEKALIKDVLIEKV